MQQQAATFPPKRESGSEFVTRAITHPQAVPAATLAAAAIQGLST